LSSRIDSISVDVSVTDKDGRPVTDLKAEDFGWVTRKLMDQAEASAGGRVVSVLEGGYDLQGLKESVAAHVTTLMGA
jgi:acetoin utilization deacetylase AcuC-like enzyme